MTAPAYPSLGGAYTDGLASGWSEAAAWLSGRAAGTDNGAARAALWDAYLFCDEQAKQIRNPPTCDEDET